MGDFHRVHLLTTMLFLLPGLKTSKARSYLEEVYPASVIEDAHLDTEQMLRKYEYPAETHYVTTADNYVLRMHRIPNPKGRPVLLMHGLLDSSATWILMGPWSGIGFFLHDLGYDVWLGNNRGNRYSRNHTTLNPDTDKSYWQFSWHEIGIFDLPAMIDYVLTTTDYTKLGYFGHSQGTTIFWVLCSMRPEYNDKIAMMHALAPVAFLKHMITPFKNALILFDKYYRHLFLEFLAHNDFLFRNCLSTEFAERLCVDTLWIYMGNSSKQLNMTRFPAVLGHMPAGCNLKQITHILQLVQSNRFCQFDYGPKMNQRHYGRNTPPNYPLEMVTVPVGLHYALNDYLSSEVDVQRLAKLLPNVVDDHLYPYKDWNHVSALWGINARELAHRDMVSAMQKYE